MGATINAKNHEKKSPLHFAARYDVLFISVWCSLMLISPCFSMNFFKFLFHLTSTEEERNLGVGYMILAFYVHNCFYSLLYHLALSILSKLTTLTLSI